MVSFNLIAAAAVALATPALAIYRLNNPVEGTVWKAGEKVTISWVDDNNPPVAPGTPVTLSLYSGNDPNDMKELTTLASTDGSALSTTVTAPADSGSGTVFSVSIKHDGQQNFSHYFSVSGGRQAPDTSSTETDASATETESTATETASSATETDSTTSEHSSSTKASSSANASSKVTRTSSSSATQSDDADDSGAARFTAVGLVTLSAVSFALVSQF
ncbi:hypothetical protein IWQ62_002706 [Dispira parvispora]|uniref:Yeast cell wall synthesis Kre9/Knh1-like N-terminal domain-containing protein n=1 Tax=Dispira parvispora TaxID=1520584 RepID=A0A9W8AT85_9FUNG|nr:hypothetical protein IWQ62_002706 [Dispira parvispora]